MFRKIMLAAAVASAFALAGCQTTDNITNVITTATSTFTNPVGKVDVYRVKNVYLATLKLANAWREYCWSKPYSAIVADPVMRPACQNRRATVRALQTANRNAAAGLRSAETFIRDNPSGNAVTYITAAWKAVNDFKNAVPVVAK
jgi:hypothetical protein